jgi:hypothetical protein
MAVWYSNLSAWILEQVDWKVLARVLKQYRWQVKQLQAEQRLIFLSVALLGQCISRGCLLACVPRRPGWVRGQAAPLQKALQPG